MGSSKTLVIIAPLLAAALVAACGREAALDGLADGGTVHPVAAPAGDVLALADGREVALAGVLAPRPGDPFGTEAQAVLERSAVARPARLLHSGAATGPAHVRDAQSRRWVQEALLEEGAVRVRTSASDRALAREMLQIESRARQSGRGLWALSDYQVRLPQEVIAERAAGFLIVEGRVVRAAETAGRLYLEFGREWRGGFSTETPLEAISEFDAAGLDLRGLEGRLIRVRGEVRPTAYGPRLRLDHPEQLERLKEP